MVNFDIEGILANLHQIPERIIQPWQRIIKPKNKKSATFIS